MKKKIKKLTLAVSIMFAITAFTACNKNLTPSIPSANNDVSIQEAAVLLNISDDFLQEYLDNMDISYEAFIENVNNTGKTLTDMKTEIETSYDCTFASYIQVIISTRNTVIPDETKFTAFRAKYAKYNTYVPTDLLNTEKNKFKDYDIEIEVADESKIAQAFDILLASNNDIGVYVSSLKQLYNCSSVEFTDVTIFGRHGNVKPKENTELLDSLFAYDKQTNEIIEKITMPVMTLKFEDPTKNISFALSNELGLAFSSKSSDSSTSLDTMLRIKNIDFQIRNIEFDKIEIEPELIETESESTDTLTSDK